ncbi:aminotransferase, class III domain protein, partial [Bordetella bronchiseptica 980-2]
YLDGSGGAAVSCLGHNHPDVRAAMHAQIDALAYAHTGFFSTEIAERLADLSGKPARRLHHRVRPARGRRNDQQHLTPLSSTPHGHRRGPAT